MVISVVKHQGAHNRTVRNRFHVSVFSLHNVWRQSWRLHKSLKVPEQILESPECLAGTVLHSSSYIICSGITRSTYFLPFFFFISLLRRVTFHKTETNIIGTNSGFHIWSEFSSGSQTEQFASRNIYNCKSRCQEGRKESPNCSLLSHYIAPNHVQALTYSLLYWAFPHYASLN